MLSERCQAAKRSLRCGCPCVGIHRLSRSISALHSLIYLFSSLLKVKRAGWKPSPCTVCTSSSRPVPSPGCAWGFPRLGPPPGCLKPPGSYSSSACHLLGRAFSFHLSSSASISIFFSQSQPPSTFAPPHFETSPPGLCLYSTGHDKASPGQPPDGTAMQGYGRNWLYPQQPQ